MSAFWLGLIFDLALEPVLSPIKSLEGCVNGHVVPLLMH